MSDDGYTQPTGDPWRWPDVLDRWQHWGWPFSGLDIVQLWPLCDIRDLDLQETVAAVLRDVDIDGRTVEDDHVLANVIDAATAEQARRTAVLDEGYFRRTGPRPAVPTALYRHVGACDDRTQTTSAMLRGLLTRSVQ